MAHFGSLAQQLALTVLGVSLPGQVDYSLRPPAKATEPARIERQRGSAKGAQEGRDAIRALTELHRATAVALGDRGEPAVAAAYLAFLRARPARELPVAERSRAMMAFVQTGQTVEAAPFVLRAGWATRDFWRELFVDARRARESEQLLALLARGFTYFQGPAAKAADLREAVQTISDYPSSHAIDLLLARASEDTKTSPEARAAFWRARARRAMRDKGRSSFEDLVRRSGSSEAWLAFAELLLEAGEPPAIVFRALKNAPRPSKARLQFLDRLGNEQHAAEESEALARSADADLPDMDDALRRWQKLRSPTRARALWDGLLAQANRNREMLLWLLQASVRLQDEERLERVAHILLRLDPKDDNLRERVGEAWDGLGQRQKAVSIWKAMAAQVHGGRSPAASTVAQNVAELFLRHGRYGAAIDAIRPQLAMHPGEVGLRRVEALALEGARRRDEAFVSWWRLREGSSPESSGRQEVHQHLLELAPAARSDDLENAASALATRSAEALDLDDSLLRAHILRRLGRTDEARSVLVDTGTRWLTTHRAARDREMARSSLAALGAALHALRAFNDERALWVRATEGEKPPCAFCMWQRATTSVDQGRMQEAEETLEEAKGLFGATPDVSLRFAELSARVARPDLAELFVSKAEPFDAPDPSIGLTLARWRLRHGDLTGAISVSKKITSGWSAPPTSDLATDDIWAAARDLSTWTEGESEGQGKALSLADLIERARPLVSARGRAHLQEDEHTLKDRLEAMRELGAWALERPLPFRVADELILASEGKASVQRETLEGLVWFAGAARDAEAGPSIRRLSHSDVPSLAALAVFAGARSGALDDAELGALLEREDLGPEVRAAAAIGLGWLQRATPNHDSEERLLRISSTATPLVATASARSLGALAPRFLAAEVMQRAQRDPGSSLAIAAASWGRPLAPYVPWSCHVPLETRSAILEMLASESGSLTPFRRCPALKTGEVPQGSNANDGASP